MSREDARGLLAYRTGGGVVEAVRRDGCVPDVNPSSDGEPLTWPWTAGRVGLPGSRSTLMFGIVLAGSELTSSAAQDFRTVDDGDPSTIRKQQREG